jgi:hypothetical protein
MVGRMRNFMFRIGGFCNCRALPLLRQCLITVSGGFGAATAALFFFVTRDQ